MLAKGPFIAEVNIRDGIIIKRDKSFLQLSAAEADTLLDAILTVMRIESYPLLPSKLSVPPFICRFYANRTMEMVRQENLDLGIPFSFIEGDDFIWIVTQAKNQYIDSTNRVGPSRGLKPPPMPDPVG